MKIQNAGLLSSAAIDLECANWAYSIKRYPVCAYLCHQVIEKSLKSAKKFQNKNEKIDLWSHNLLDCTNWNHNIKRKFNTKIQKISEDQERTRYFSLEDFKQPWENYNSKNTFSKLRLAREVFGVSISYMPINGMSLIEIAQKPIDKSMDKRIIRLVKETLKIMDKRNDFEMEFTSKLNEILLSKNRFYINNYCSPFLNGMKNEYENALRPEYLDFEKEDEDFALNFLDIYEGLSKNFRIKKPSTQMLEISKHFMEIARYDLVTSYLLSCDNIHNLSLFYANQSIEKSLKSLINLKSRTPIMRGHDIIHLCNQTGLRKVAEQISENKLLNEYLKYRYNDGNDIVNYDNSELVIECLSIAERIYNLLIHIKNKI